MLGIAVVDTSEKTSAQRERERDREQGVAARS